MDEPLGAVAPSGEAETDTAKTAVKRILANSSKRVFFFMKSFLFLTFIFNILYLRENSNLKKKPIGPMEVHGPDWHYE
ncbi:MAG: hypothetical protein U0K37_06875 [Acutalibacteraceae bacterium]|nr:hypothetical protein [Acutalibacteraceae bacterium]